MSFIRSLIIFAALLFAIIHFGSNYLVSEVFKRWLGVEVSVGSVRWGFSKQHLVIRNMRLHNPAGFSKTDLAKIDRIEGDYKLSEIKKGIIFFPTLEVMIDDVWLENKSLSGANILELYPVRAALQTLPEEAKKSLLPIHFQIGKVKLTMDNLSFQTQLGNDLVLENRTIESSAEELTELTTPDRIALYTVFLVLRAAGWQTLLPSKLQVTDTVQAQMYNWIEDLKKKGRDLQTQLNQTISEKLAARE